MTLEKVSKIQKSMNNNDEFPERKIEEIELIEAQTVKSKKEKERNKVHKQAFN